MKAYTSTEKPPSAIDVPGGIFVSSAWRRGHLHHCELAHFNQLSSDEILRAICQFVLQLSQRNGAGTTGQRQDLTSSDLILTGQRLTSVQ